MAVTLKFSNLKKFKKRPEVWLQYTNLPNLIKIGLKILTQMTDHSKHFWTRVVISTKKIDIGLFLLLTSISLYTFNKLVRK